MAFVPNDPSWYVSNALSIQERLAAAQAAAVPTLGLTPQKYDPRARGFVKNREYDDRLDAQADAIADFEALISGVPRPARRFTVEGTFQDAFGNIQGTGTQQLEDPGFADNVAAWNTLRSLPASYDAVRALEQEQADRSDQTLLQGARTMQQNLKADQSARNAAAASFLRDARQRSQASEESDPFRIPMDIFEIGSFMSQG